jgi:Lrp/AsnC family leucine-responsive transcriptional regulator
MNLDKIDVKILKILQQKGDLSNSLLAEQVNISKTACWNRTKRLIDEGYIQGIHASLDPDKIGLPVLVCVGVILEDSTAESFATFEEHVQKIPLIIECILLAGEYDYWMKIRVKDVQAYKRLYANVLLSLPGVSRIRSFFTLGEVKKKQEYIFDIS